VHFNGGTSGDLDAGWNAMRVRGIESLWKAFYLRNLRQTCSDFGEVSLMQGKELKTCGLEHRQDGCTSDWHGYASELLNFCAEESTKFSTEKERSDQFCTHAKRRPAGLLFS
jgi:hypothetical protein